MLVNPSSIMALRYLLRRVHSSKLPQNIIVSSNSLINHHHRHLCSSSSSLLAQKETHLLPSFPNKNGSGDGDDGGATLFPFSQRTKKLPVEETLNGFSAIVEKPFTDTWIKDFAHFAVDAINAKERMDLQFLRSLGAASFGGSGGNYEITLEAMNGDRKRKLYRAEVVVGMMPEEKRLTLANWCELKPTTTTTPAGSLDQQQEDGGSVTIEQPQTDYRVKAFAQFAVDVINDKERLHLQFLRVVNAMSMGFGMIYEITLEAMDGSERKFYHAAVFDELKLEDRLTLVDWCEWKPTPETIECLDAQEGVSSASSRPSD